MLTPIIFVSTFSILLENLLYAILLFVAVDLLIIAIPCLIKSLGIGMFRKTVKALFFLSCNPFC